jgi:hypothetical protein
MQRLFILIPIVFALATLPNALPSAHAKSAPPNAIPQMPHAPSEPGGGGMAFPTAQSSMTYAPPSYHSVCFIDHYGNGCFLTESSPIPSGAPCHCGGSNGITR